MRVILIMCLALVSCFTFADPLAVAPVVDEQAFDIVSLLVGLLGELGDQSGFPGLARPKENLNKPARFIFQSRSKCLVLMTLKHIYILLNGLSKITQWSEQNKENIAMKVLPDKPFNDEAFTLTPSAVLPIRAQYLLRRCILYPCTAERTPEKHLPAEKHRTIQGQDDGLFS